MARIVEEGMLLGFFVQWAISSQLERSRLEHRPRVRGGCAAPGWRARGRCGWREKNGVEISGVKNVEISGVKNVEISGVKTSFFACEKMA